MSVAMFGSSFGAKQGVSTVRDVTRLSSCTLRILPSVLTLGATSGWVSFFICRSKLLSPGSVSSMVNWHVRGPVRAPQHQSQPSLAFLH